MCHGFCCCAAPPSCLPLWKVQKCFCVWISGNSDKLPEGLVVICPDWSPPKPKEDAAVAQSSTSFSLCFVSHFFFSICCLHPTLFFCPVCAAPAPHWCPIPFILFLKEPNLLFVSVSFIKKGLKFQSSWPKIFYFKFIRLCFAISKCQSHALARLVSTLHQDQIWDLRAHCCAQPWQRDYNSHGKDNTAERLGNLTRGCARIHFE